MKKNGFTLVELLAVVAILGVLAVIAGGVITNSIGGAKSDIDKLQMETLSSTAKLFFQDNFGEEGYNFESTKNADNQDVYNICIQNDLVGDDYLDKFTDDSNNPIFGIIEITDVKGNQARLEVNIDTTKEENNCVKQ